MVEQEHVCGKCGKAGAVLECLVCEFQSQDDAVWCQWKGVEGAPEGVPCVFVGILISVGVARCVDIVGVGCWAGRSAHIGAEYIHCLSVAGGGKIVS
jgi:hypothetical protein